MKGSVSSLKASVFQEFREGNMLLWIRDLIRAVIFLMVLEIKPSATLLDHIPSAELFYF